MTQRIIVLALTASFSFLAARDTNASPPPKPIDAANDHLHCATNYGSISIKPGITQTSSAITKFKIKGKLAGCVDSDNGGVEIASGSYGGTLTSLDPVTITTFFEASIGVSGTITVKWEVAPGAAKLTVPTTSITPNTVALGNVDLFPSDDGISIFQFLDGYLTFITGGGTASSTGSFTGGNNGNGTALIGIMTQDLDQTISPEFNTMKGLHGLVPLGIGAANFE